MKALLLALLVLAVPQLLSQVLQVGVRVVVVDDVISTGSTLQAMRLIMQRAGAQVIAEAAIFTEGERAKWRDVISLGHLPVFTD